MTTEGTDSAHWSNYSEIQAAKHQLLGRYLGGWFPILASAYPRIVYLDSHAGRGRYETGELGSPLIALTTLLEHSLRARLFARCSFTFVLVEDKPKNMERLESELAKLGKLPDAVKVFPVEKNYESVLRELLRSLKDSGRPLAPTFFFCDPYGFTIPISLLKEILSFEATEVLVTFMSRYVDMALSQPVQEANLDIVFGSETEWRSLRSIASRGERYQRMIAFYVEALGVRYSSVLEMRGSHREPKYSLIHATNHPSGRNLMKDSMWSVSPDGSFVIYQGHDPSQLTLITEDIDLDPLQDALLSEFAGKKVAFSELQEWLLPLRWREKHLKDALRRLRKSNVVEASGYRGRFGFKHNPFFAFPPEEN